MRGTRFFAKIRRSSMWVITVMGSLRAPVKTGKVL
jgi:hypothetical protein